jgi:uncharacterized membrane protein YsdA (DUF1294 family)/cold shock CspA family protein
MRYSGKITYWKDAQGYGFITPTGGGKEVFVHIKSFINKQKRPLGGEMVSYGITTDNKGRFESTEVLFAGEYNPFVKSSSVTNEPSVVLVFIAAIFIIVVAICVLFDKLPIYMLGVYLAASMVSFIAYGMDKSAAEEGRWRISEARLTMFALIGGWPGALIAQRLFRHKTKKLSFQIAFWFVVLINCGVLIYLLTLKGSEIR